MIRPYLGLRFRCRRSKREGGGIKRKKVCCRRQAMALGAHWPATVGSGGDQWQWVVAGGTGEWRWLEGSDFEGVIVFEIDEGSKDLVTDLDQYIANHQRKIDEAELCSTQPTFNPEEDVSVDTLTSLEVKDDTQMEDYLIDTSEECEVFQIEPEIVIALNEGEDDMKIDVNSDKQEKLQIESEEDQPLVLVQPPTLPCTFGTPYKGVEVRERLEIFYNADTFVLDEPDTIDSFVLEVPNELLNMKEGVHASLPKYVDAPFVVDISKGEGIT
ncbi:hypothetical protein Syun_006673 [Stephania yunnanensis]|uniref:Uncharacterized protein n=1 Tax=Stephania yunnanensis TaxID=152371 RepID=A0AAP0KWZ5_9MAGN